MSGQTFNDRLTAARHTLAGQGLARVVCKATTEEAIGPKKKHLDYLLHCTNEPNVSIPQLANLLIERTQHSSWVVVFKALVTVHNLMCYGNERFTQYLASSNCTFQLSNFLDKSGVQGYDMSTYIRRYAKYLNEKAVTYRTVAFDFCKAKRGKEDGILRTMSNDKLLKTLPILQAQLDALLEFDCTSNDLTNGVINCCFMLLFRDLIRLFACYNDGIINLLEKYFDMNKKNCREALDIYKKFLIRMDRVAELLKVAENVGVDKGDIPDLTKAPSSLLDALEQHLAALEGKRGAVNASAAAARATNLKNAVSALTSTSSSFSSAGGNGAPTQEMNGGKVDESLRRAVEEEAAVMNQLKFDRESPLLWEQPSWEGTEIRMKDAPSSPDGMGNLVSPPTTGSVKTNPFLASPASDQPNITSATNQGIIDLFSSPPANAKPASTGGEASDDLLCMGSNPFADSLFGNSAQTAGQPPSQQPSFTSFGTNGFNATTPSSTGGFASDASFAAAFGSGNSTGFQAFGDVLQPMTTTASTKIPVSSDVKTSQPAAGGLIKGDLDSCLASLAQNLDINGPKQAMKKQSVHQWGSSKAPAKTGGTTWAPQGTVPAVVAPNMGWTPSPKHNYQQVGAAPNQWGSAGMMAGPFPQQPAVSGMVQQQQPFGGMPGMRPVGQAGMTAVVNVNMMSGMGMGVAGTQQMPQQTAGLYAVQPQCPVPPQNSSSINDPFGAL